MAPINLKEARRGLSELVKAAERGESAVIARRGREVARIVSPAKKPGMPVLDLSESRKSIKIRGKPLSETVIEMRRGGRY